MKKYTKPFFLTLALSSLLLCSGCVTDNISMPERHSKHEKYSHVGQVGSNFLGIVAKEEASFAVPSKTSFNLHTDELMRVYNPSGNKTTFLWGLITVNDY